MIFTKHEQFSNYESVILIGSNNAPYPCKLITDEA
jgi:hypothetical protein